VPGAVGRPFNLAAPLGDLLATARADAIRSTDERLARLTADASAEASTLGARAGALRSSIEYRSHGPPAASDGEAAEDPARFEREELSDVDAALRAVRRRLVALRRAAVPFRRLRQQVAAWKARLEDGSSGADALPEDPTVLLRAASSAGGGAGAGAATEGGAAGPSATADAASAVRAVRSAQDRWVAAWCGVGLVEGAHPFEAAGKEEEAVGAGDGEEDGAGRADAIPAASAPPTAGASATVVTAAPAPESEALSALLEARRASEEADAEGAAEAAGRAAAAIDKRAEQLQSEASATLAAGSTYTLVLLPSPPCPPAAPQGASAVPEAGAADVWVPSAPGSGGGGSRQASRRSATRPGTRGSRHGGGSGGGGGDRGRGGAGLDLAPVGMRFAADHGACPLLFALPAVVTSAGLRTAAERRQAGAEAAAADA